MLILGFNSTHDASAALLGDGRILCAVEEERFTRKKHHYGFPEFSIDACLRTAGVTWRDIDCVTFYWDPYRGLLPFGLHFLSHLPTSARYLGHQPGIWSSFVGLPRELERRYGYRGPFRFHSHHLNHLASACFPSPFDEAAALTVDGTGEWETTVLSHFRDGRIERLGHVDYPHSIGKLWEVATQWLGFKPNSGEGKVMGLAPYGRPTYLDAFRKIILPRGRGGYRMDESWFLYHLGSEIKFGPRWLETFGPPREPESEIEPRHEDVARTLQEVTEIVVARIVRELLRRTGCRNLCLAGGVGLNSVMNGKLLANAGVEDIFIQPSAGDAGAALGSALVQYHLIEGGKTRERMRHGHWGTSATEAEMKRAAESSGSACRRPDRLEDECARLVAEGRILGWFQGRMEYGPRALGARSIIADARRPDMKDILNHRVKHREGFRPFAPACLAEHAAEWFEGGRYSPFMLLVFPVVPGKRSQVPSITHVDGTGRLQTVDEDSEPRYRRLIEAFHERTGVPIVLNTSFNVRGEPIVETPDQAVECFRKTGLDVLALGDWLLEKEPGEARGDEMESSC
jgi:carbamoyltransferase